MNAPKDPPVAWIRTMTHQLWTIKVYAIQGPPPSVATTAEDNAYVAIKAQRHGVTHKESLLIVHQERDACACLFVFWGADGRLAHQGWEWTGSKWKPAASEPLLDLPHVRELIDAERRTLFPLPATPVRWDVKTLWTRTLLSALRVRPDRNAFLTFRYSCRQRQAVA